MTDMAIVTSEDDLTTSRPEIPAGPTRDEEMHAYFACPKGKERLPGVLIIHEAMGVTSHIEDVVRRFAKARFAALAPNLYIKQAPPPVDDQPTILTALGQFDEKEAVDNLASAADWLKHHQRCNGKVGAVGFCIGGKLAMLLAFTTDKVSAVVPFYGALINKTFPGMPAPPANVHKLSPMDLADGLTVPLQGHYAGKDRSISQDEIRQMEQHFKSGSKNAELFLYPDAEHAFYNDTRANYLEASAKQAMSRTLDFLRRQLS
jgi:carboxymethylenebutenolidase